MCSESGKTISVFMLPKGTSHWAAQRCTHEEQRIFNDDRERLPPPVSAPSRDHGGFAYPLKLEQVRAWEISHHLAKQGIVCHKREAVEVLQTPISIVQALYSCVPGLCEPIS